MEKLNKSETIIMQVVRGEINESITKRHYKRKDGSFFFIRATRYDNAIESLQKKGLIFIDEDNVIKECKL